MPRVTETEDQREAKRAYEREWRRKKWANDPEYRKRKKNTDGSWERRLREEIEAYKLRHGCSVCGYKRSARALTFHHPNANKEFDIGARIDKGRKRIWDEIGKCVLLCANCHAETHDSRL